MNSISSKSCVVAVHFSFVKFLNSRKVYKLKNLEDNQGNMILKPKLSECFSFYYAQGYL